MRGLHARCCLDDYLTKKGWENWPAECWSEVGNNESGEHQIDQFKFCWSRALRQELRQPVSYDFQVNPVPLNSTNLQGHTKTMSKRQDTEICIEWNQNPLRCGNGAHSKMTIVLEDPNDSDLEVCWFRWEANTLNSFVVLSSMKLYVITWRRNRAGVCHTCNTKGTYVALQTLGHFKVSREEGFSQW